MTYLGIDPGARYTGVVVRRGEALLSASTIVRPDDVPIITWAMIVPRIIDRDVVAHFPEIQAVGIEGISDPKGWQNGKRSPINPKDIIKAGIVLGSIANHFYGRYPLVAVPPKRNGSGLDYPKALTGRRPKDLHGSAAGAGTRNHEKSAWDIAGEVAFLISDNFDLDARQNWLADFGFTLDNTKGTSAPA